MEEDFAITSLREVAQEHLLTHMIDDCLGHSDGYQPANAAVLVCDDTAAQVISCSIKVDHLVANRSIIAIQSLTVSRQPYQGIEVIYCIAPHMESIKQVALDWQKGKPPPYSRANIYFLTEPDEAVLHLIREAPLMGHLHYCKVLNLGYAPVDAQGFITARVDGANASPWIGLNELYGVQSGASHWNQVASVCCSTRCSTALTSSSHAAVLHSPHHHTLQYCTTRCRTALTSQSQLTQRTDEPLFAGRRICLKFINDAADVGGRDASPH